MLIQGGHGEWRPAVENGFKSCPPADCSFFSPLLVYTCATCISWGGAGAGNNSITGVWQTLPPSSSAPIPPPPWSFSEDLFPAQWHVDVYNGDGWWLALPHRGTDGLLPKRLSASLHQSLSDSPSRNRAWAQYWPCSGVCWRVCVCVCVCVRLLLKRASTTCY